MKPIFQNTLFKVSGPNLSADKQKNEIVKSKTKSFEVASFYQKRVNMQPLSINMDVQKGTDTAHTKENVEPVCKNQEQNEQENENKKVRVSK